ncbi:hypothetical protein CHUAL_010612 [Chamberlinius hualienensis]
MSFLKNLTVMTLRLYPVYPSIYKPGQIVKFRVLHVTTLFKPSYNNIKSILVENPSQVRLSQWIFPPSENGITDLSFPLSDEPQLGIWTINILDVMKTFVKEYVLDQLDDKLAAMEQTMNQRLNDMEQLIMDYNAKLEKVVETIENNGNKLNELDGKSEFIFQVNEQKQHQFHINELKLNKFCYDLESNLNKMDIKLDEFKTKFDDINHPQISNDFQNLKKDIDKVEIVVEKVNRKCQLNRVNKFIK